MEEPVRSDESTPPAADERLGSWKAIAAYVKRDVTTVQRWERREGMPVHRHQHDKRGSVYAFQSEIDAWLKDRSPRAEEPPPASPIARLWIPAALILLAAALVGAWWLLRNAPAAPDRFANARISTLTDFDGFEQAAAISRDGKYVAFLSDRDGKVDAWITQLGSGEFHNLTNGTAPELLNPELRSVAFTPDGSQVTLWTRMAGTPEPVNLWAVPAMGGALREYRRRAVEIDWTRDGKRLVFHTADQGDPMFVADAPDGVPSQVHVGPRGVHCHYPVWAPDDSTIYFVRGDPPDAMDLWRLKRGAPEPEQLTHHNSRVEYPVFVDAHTLLYLATTEDGAGPWLHSFDIESGISQRIGFGMEQYSSLSTSADGSRLVATVEHGKTSLWRVPIGAGIAAETDATRIDLPTVGAGAPRFGPGFLLYVSAKNDGHSIWKLADGKAIELWSGSRTRVVGGPAISRDGKRVAFVAEGADGTRLNLLDADRAGATVIAPTLEVRGTPSWSPDGTALAVGVATDAGPRLYRVPLDGGAPAPLAKGYAINPTWSADGRFIVYLDADVGPAFEVKAVDAQGQPFKLPAISLPRGARRVAALPGAPALIVLEGEMHHTNFWRVDIDTGERRQLTNFGSEYTIRGFDVSADGREIVFDRRQDNSDLALIELGAR